MEAGYREFGVERPSESECASVEHTGLQALSVVQSSRCVLRVVAGSIPLLRYVATPPVRPARRDLVRLQAFYPNSHGFGFL